MKQDLNKIIVKDDWETPEYLFNKYNNIYKFDLDVCASSENHKCDDYFDISTDGLSLSKYDIYL